MKLPRLYNALTHQYTSHTNLFSTPSRRALFKHQPCIHPQKRPLTLSQTQHTPQAATQQARTPDGKEEEDAERPPQPNRKYTVHIESPKDKQPSDRQTTNNPTSRQPPPAAELHAPWGNPPPRRKITKHSADIADLLNSTTRAAERSPASMSASRSSSLDPSRPSASASASTFGAPRRQQLLTPTGRRQEHLAHVFGDSAVGGIHARLEPPPPLRMDPFMGRAVVVNRVGTPLGRALGLLNYVNKLNSVHTHLRAQRFHERPGLRRKRLKSERWRKRFLVSFKHVVGKIQHMKSQGW